MKTLTILFLILLSTSALATTYQTTSRTFKYDRDSNAIIVSESQRITDSNGAVHSRGIGTYIPLDEPFARQVERYNNGGQQGLIIREVK